MKTLLHCVPLFPPAHWVWHQRYPQRNDCRRGRSSVACIVKVPYLSWTLLLFQKYKYLLPSESIPRVTLNTYCSVFCHTIQSLTDCAQKHCTFSLSYTPFGFRFVCVTLYIRDIFFNYYLLLIFPNNVCCVIALSPLWHVFQIMIIQYSTRRTKKYTHTKYYYGEAEDTPSPFPFNMVIV